MDAVAHEAVPYARAISAAESDAASTVITTQQKDQQLDVTAIQDTAPGSAAEQEEQQCLSKAESLDDPPSSTGLDQMEVAIDRCTPQGAPGSDEQDDAQIVQIGEEALGEVESDVTKADAAFGSLAQLFARETSLTDDLAVPADLANARQVVLTTLSAVRADANAGETAGSMTVASDAGAILASDISTLGDEVTRLTKAMGLPDSS